jgi:hypothetical protein
MGGNVVKIYSGDLPKYFNFGTPTAPVISIGANMVSQPLFKESPYSTFQATLTSGIANAITATVNIKGSNDPATGSGIQIGGLTTTSGAALVTSQAGAFAGGLSQLAATPAQAVPITVGMGVVGPGISAGTVVQAVSSAGSITLSQNATLTQGSVGLVFYAQNWCATALGTITLSGTTAQATPSFSDGFATTSTWRYVQAVVSNVTGTLPVVQVMMGV